MGQSQNARRVVPSTLLVFYRIEDIKSQAGKNSEQRERTLAKGKKKKGGGEGEAAALTLAHGWCPRCIPKINCGNWEWSRHMVDSVLLGVNAEVVSCHDMIDAGACNLRKMASRLRCLFAFEGASTMGGLLCA